MTLDEAIKADRRKQYQEWSVQAKEHLAEVKRILHDLGVPEDCNLSVLDNRAFRDGIHLPSGRRLIAQDGVLHIYDYKTTTPVHRLADLDVIQDMMPEYHVPYSID